jgi:hypothetical protein
MYGSNLCSICSGTGFTNIDGKLIVCQCKKLPQTIRDVTGMEVGHRIINKVLASKTKSPFTKKPKLVRTPIDRRISQVNEVLYRQILPMLNEQGYEDGFYNDPPDQGWRKLADYVSYLDNDPRFLAAYHEGWKKGNKKYEQKKAGT